MLQTIRESVGWWQVLGGGTQCAGDWACRQGPPGVPTASRGGTRKGKRPLAEEERVPPALAPDVGGSGETPPRFRTLNNPLPHLAPRFLRP